eukprot:7168800-Alexandrium_andersonii.AAC.1
MQEVPPEVPPRTREQLQEHATPGAYLPHSPETKQMSSRGISASCSSSKWFFQGKGFKDFDLRFVADA